MPEDGKLIVKRSPVDGRPNGNAGSFGKLTSIEDKLSRALETIDAQRQQLSTVFNAVTDAIIVIDSRGIIETVNDSACEMFGRPSFDLIHHSVNKLMPEAVALHHDRYLRDSKGTKTAARLGLPRTLSGIDAKGRQFPISISLSEIPRSIDGQRRFVATIRDLTSEREREDRIRFLAYHDETTKLPNQDGTFSYLESYFQGDSPKPLLFVHLALNNSSQLMASFGIDEFEQLVVAFSQRLKRVFGTALLIARGFGNTFHVILPLEERDDLETNLISVIAEPLEIQDMSIAIDVSVGTIDLPDQASSARETLQRVTATLLQIKSESPQPGKPSLHAYVPSIIKDISRRTRLVHKIRQAIDGGEFSVYLQPKVDLADGRWVGAEAPARWTQPDGSMIPPVEFIPLAEKAGLVSRLNRSILLQTLQLASESDWARSAPISVNISAQDLVDPSFTMDVADALGRYGLPASALELELTERDVVSGTLTMHATLEHLRDLGVSVAMDDFGTGYSSLAALADLPVDILKIDREFLRRIEDREADRRLLRTLLTLGQDLGRRVVVEGVETEAQADILRTLGARWVQGYLYAKPAPAIAVLNDTRRPVGG